MKRLYSIALLSIGVVFISLGIVGVFLPILHGIVFLMIGFACFALISPSFRARLERHTVKYPLLLKVLLKIDDWDRRARGRLGIGDKH